MSSASSNQSFVHDGAGYEELYPLSCRDPDELSERSPSAFSPSSKNEDMELAEPNSCCAFQRCKEGPTHDLVRYSLEVHQGLEGFQMIEWVLDSIVALNLRHSEFLWQGTGIDRYSEWRVSPIH